MQARKFYNHFIPRSLISFTYILSFAIFYITQEPLFSDNDLPWHLASGNLILSAKSLPLTDPWSYTSNGISWYNISWLWDIFISYILQTFGESGLFAIGVALKAFLLSLVTLLLLERKNISENSIVATIFLIGFVLVVYASLRPQIVTYILSVIYSLILYKNRNSLSFKSLLILPFLMILWVNTHGGFLVGFTIIGAYIIESFLSKNYTMLKRLIIISAICGVSIFLNPYGIDIIPATLRTLDSVITKYITEWHPITFGNHSNISLFLIIFILFSQSANPKIPLADKIISFFWLFSALSSLRNFAIFSLVSAPYLATCLTIASKQIPYKDNYSKIHRLSCFMGAIIVNIVLILTPVQKYLGIKNYLYDENKVPLDAIEYIKKYYPNTRFWNEYSIGGYLIYYAGNNFKVSVDPRAGTAYPEEVLQESIYFLNMDKKWDEIINKYNINGLIIPNNNNFTKLDNQGWNLVFKGKNTSIYIRKGYKNGKK